MQRIISAFPLADAPVDMDARLDFPFWNKY